MKDTTKRKETNKDSKRIEEERNFKNHKDAVNDDNDSEISDDLDEIVSDENYEEDIDDLLEETESDKEDIDDHLEENEEIKDEELKEFDFTKIHFSKAKTNSRCVGEAGIVTVINSKKNGRRVLLSKKLIEKLNSPNSVQFGFIEKSLVIGENLNSGGIRFNLKKAGAKSVVYSSELAKEITEELDLIFDKNVCVTLRKVDYVRDGDSIIAIVSE